ncbi:MAG: Rne/Rng family ribonuclease [Rhodospirillales bacterium]|nr:Rne/Rng family ribonuclease [Rhodospirillales bacterium]
MTTTKKMLIDATHPEETRVVVISGTRLDDFDVEVASRKQLKGNIYLAKVTRVEPSLQAAFVDYGGNRHGFLAFSEIHPDYYQIPVEDRQALLAEDAAAGHAERAAERPDNNAAAAEGAGEDAGEGMAEGAEPNATPVEVLGGDSDDDLEVRRPVAVRRRHYKIQEVIKRRQIVLVQVVKEERGTKGAALTTYLSLAGRYCVLMPNTARGGGISRKIAGGADRSRLKSVVGELEIPDGMAVIVRTAGAERTKIEIKRDYEYLIRTWTEVRERTLESIAPALVYEEGSIIKRAIRDLYASDIDEVIVAGDEAYRQARELMKLLVPSHIKRVKPYTDTIVSLLRRYQVEDYLASIHSPQVQLRSGGYIVINPTEALVSIDVNSGRATRERHIEETALKTNVEAAEEIARQLRLRDLAGLIVIDFIDMESSRNQAQVERRLKEAMRTDRARIQIGRISHFGLLEMSRQRLRPSLIETSSVPCPHCDGTGIRRATDTSALTVLRAIEDEGVRQRADEITVHVATPIVLYILNQKRAALSELEQRFAFRVVLAADDTLVPPAHRIDRTKARSGTPIVVAPPPALIASAEGDAEADAEAGIEAAESGGATESEEIPSGDFPLTPHHAHIGGEREGAPGEGGGRPGRAGLTPRAHQQDAPLSGRERGRRRGRGGRGRAGERHGGEAPRGVGAPGTVYPPGAPQPDGYIGGPQPSAPGAILESGDEHAPGEPARDSGHGQPGQPTVGGFPDAGLRAPGAQGGDGPPREGRRRRRRGRRGGRNRHRPGADGAPAGGEHRGNEHRGNEHRGGSEGQPGGGMGVPQDGARPPRESGDRGASFNAHGDSPVRPPREGGDRGASFNAHVTPPGGHADDGLPARDTFKVTTPAEAGIAFLDGPRLGGYDAEPEEIVERPAPRPQPVALEAPAPEPARERPRPEASRFVEAKPAAYSAEAAAPAAKAEPAREETPEERERRLRASKTEIVEVVKAEGEPAKRGWWRRGG